MAREIQKGLRKSGKSQGIIKKNGYGRQLSENLFILFKREKDLQSHDSLSPSPSVLSPSPSALGSTLKRKEIAPMGSKFFHLRVTPRFEVIKLTPLK